jgi:anaerobic selenocysteine-containing dehydrogenase
VIELPADYARRNGIERDDEVVVRSNETSVRLKARISRTLAANTVRAPEEHVRELAHDVEVVKA